MGNTCDAAVKEVEEVKALPALHKAAEDGRLDEINELISKGTDVNSNGEDGRGPLVFACEQGHLDVVKTLIEKGANVNSKDNVSIYEPVQFMCMNQCNRCTIDVFLYIKLCPLLIGQLVTHIMYTLFV
eukprot:GHVR01145502.1.p1 GENE.GHVR01145502.1~~GHVR01145502.1.p1  ORF type:complete len:128 (-),score=23.22 GHVR01145502.1:900-1283(-)